MFAIRHSAVCFLFCLLGMSTVRAQVGDTLSREPGLDSLGQFIDHYLLLKRETLPKNCYLSRLSNGLKVLVCRDKTAPITRIEFVNASGVAAEPEDFQGAAAVLSELLVGPNDKLRSSSGLAARLEALGLQMDTELSTGALKVIGSAPAANWEAAMEMLSWMVRYPRIDTIRVEGAKRMLATQAARAEQDPKYYLNTTFEDRLWGPEKRLHSLQPEFLPLRRLPVNAVQRFHGTQFVPNASLVAIAGNMPVREAFALADTLWSDWRRSSTYASTSIEGHRLVSDVAVALTYPDLESPILRVGWALPGILDRPKNLALYDLAAAYLNSAAGPLQTKLVLPGLADSLRVQHQPSVIGGSLEMHLRVPPQQLLFAIEEVWRALDTLGMGEAHLNRTAMQAARNQLRFEIARQRQSLTHQTRRLAEAWAGVGINQLAEYELAVDTISLSSLSRFYQDKLVEGPMVLAVMLQAQLFENYAVQYYLSDFDREPPTQKKDTIIQASPLAAVLKGPDSAQVASEMQEIAKRMEEMTGTKADLDSIYQAYLVRMRVMTEINILPEVAAAQNAIDKLAFPDAFVYQDTMQAFLDSIQRKIGGLTVPYFEVAGRLPASAKTPLNDIIRFLALRPDLKLYVDGHTSSSGTSEENQAASLVQAEKLANYIIENYDIDPKRIVPRGMGETMLAVPERSTADRQRNERIEFNFLP